jgi:hypothetical protein
MRRCPLVHGLLYGPRLDHQLAGIYELGLLIVVQIALLAATIRAFAFMLSSLWATLQVTFVGVPESAPRPP